jgi:hypothetical protein
MLRSEKSRRQFLKKSVLLSSAFYSGITVESFSKELDDSVKILNPCNRVPVSFIIDDSTALVNMAYFGIPQFKEVFPDQYTQNWKLLPQEIPDDFVREFRDWCGENGVKGKYSMVPYPACTGWLHRFIPGWAKEDLKASLKLVRETMLDNWDIHPEMISHTRVIDIKTGLPYPDPTPDYMENWEWSQNKSADELGSYMAYALNVLKEAGLPCEGITTPGGFGSRNISNLGMGTLQSVRDVFQGEIPHFFRDVRTDPNESVEPELFHVSGLESSDPKCSVHIIGCTGDWFGGWDGLTPGDTDRFITPDLAEGRLVDVIDNGEPAILVCHWPGIYYNGTKLGFNIFKTVVKRLHEKYDHLIWMKLSEIARYWACKKLTTFEVEGKKIRIKAPFHTERFTIGLNRSVRKAVQVSGGSEMIFEKTSQLSSLSAGKFYVDKKESVLCFNLPKGESHLTIS